MKMKKIGSIIYGYIEFRTDWKNNKAGVFNLLCQLFILFSGIKALIVGRYFSAVLNCLLFIPVFILNILLYRSYLDILNLETLKKDIEELIEKIESENDDDTTEN